MEILDHFRKITAIPRCSGKTGAMQKYLADFGREQGFQVFEDAAGNVLCRKEPAAICLQAHHDMVCLGEEQETKIVEEGEFLRADNTTLGADNGMGVAAMLALMEKGVAAEYLFTNDEEIGLIGANGMEVPVTAKKLLNLDSEELGEVCIGCAGGVDIFGTLPVELSAPAPRGILVELETVELPGGHSGIQIGEEVDNALQVLARFLEPIEGQLVSFRGGERVNAIPRKAYATVWIADPESLERDERILMRRGEGAPEKVIANGKTLLGLLATLPHGVLEWNDRYGIPDRSINLALAGLKENGFLVTLSGRAMTPAGLKQVEQETVKQLGEGGCQVTCKGKYVPWAPVESAFARQVLETTRELLGKGEFSVIHAGLECAVINDVLGGIDAASIGPDIFDPHTGRERVSVPSVEKFMEIVERIFARG